MNSSELRIGNWIEWNNIERQISLADFYEEYITGQSFFHMNPISTTEEWLKKFGFEFSEYSWKLNIKDLTYLVYDSEGLSIFSECESDDYYNTKINLGKKYIHQIQNIYYDLKVEELIIKKQ